MSVERRTRLEDGFEITDTVVDGVLMGSAVVPIPTAQQTAEQAAVERRRDVLRAQVDPNQNDPGDKAFKDALAFEALVQIDGVAAALAVADEIVAAAVMAGPKGTRP